jgi:protocatechuate 3,4-dioxygenase beta subunit
VLALALVLELARASVAAQAPAAIEGRVVAADTGQPIAGATVQAATLPTTPGNTSAPVRTKADAEGRFLLSGLAAGRINLSASADGFVTENYRPTSPSQLPQLREGQRLTDVTLRLSRAASLSGVVRDTSGRPMTGVTVTLYRRGILTVRRAWLSTRVAILTGADGRYSANNLTPGEYVVAVPMLATTVPRTVIDEMRAIPAADRATAPILRSLGESRFALPSVGLQPAGDFFVALTSGASTDPVEPPPGDGRAPLIYRTTYYPQATTLNDAGVVELKSGDRRDTVNITMRPAPAQRVSGTVVRDGRPLPYVALRLFSEHADERSIDYDGEAAVTVTNSSGEYVFLNVTPGDYSVKTVLVSASPGRNLPVIPPAQALSAWAARSIRVGAGDLQLEPLLLQSPLSVRGTLVFGGAGAGSPASQTRTSVWLAVVDGGLMSPPAAVAVEPDGRFVLAGAMAGRYHLFGGSPAGWTVKSIRAGDLDVLDAPLTLVDRDIDVTIELTPSLIGVSGLVVDDAGTAVANAHIVAFPASYTRWIANGMSIRTMRSLRSSPTGSYNLTGLPPGAYLLAALADGDTEAWPDRRVVESIAKVAQMVVLQEGRPVTLTLKVQRLK